MPDEIFLRVYLNRSELVEPDGNVSTFYEGVMSEEAKRRYHLLQDAFNAGFLEDVILACRGKGVAAAIGGLHEQQKKLLDSLIQQVTSEVGRALIGITVMQLCVKSIVPEQSIRLHKGSNSRAGFSWKQGISMRSLDKRFITPILRKYNLVRLNADGFMMTRSLAENYPYSRVYKAAIRGARDEWLDIVENVELGEMLPKAALYYFISQLVNRADEFVELADKTVQRLTVLLTSSNKTKQQVLDFIWDHVEQSDYAARLMEIAMHSLMQAIIETGTFLDLQLKPLSQMRSANKKHGNVGDIELLTDDVIVEAWDAKYGKTYLRDEIEELTEKMAQHRDLGIVGFVTSGVPQRMEELLPRVKDVEDLYGVNLRIIPFAQWVDIQFKKLDDVQSGILAKQWITAYTESIAQKRRDIAPIDEPCHHWLLSLSEKLDNL